MGIKKLSFVYFVFTLAAFSFTVGCGQNETAVVGPRIDNPKKDELVCNNSGESLVVEPENNDFEQMGPDQRDRFITPTEYVPESEWPNFEDDLNFSNMHTAIDRQIERFAKMDLSGTIRLGEKSYPLERAYRSLVRFKKMAQGYEECQKNQNEKCWAQFNAEMKANFDLFRPRLEKGDPRFGEQKPVLFTAYYTPQIEAAKVKTAEYKYAIYAAPSQKQNKTRVEIDFKNALTSQNLELYYAKDLFDLYLMHVQGGGRVKVVGSSAHEMNYLSYAGTNGLPWNFISKYMIEKNMIRDQSITAQRLFLKNNKHREEEIYSTCPSYVFFSESHNPPLGSDRVSLTDNRSIATDIRYYKFKGLLSYVMAKRPTESDVEENVNSCGKTGFRPYSRFYLDQDTGGAIRGKARVDLYFGEGKYAEKAAYNTVERGDLYFFISKL